ncbi:putative bifunctional diguanylate cyclase/phosphodiesterase [Cellulomonas wangsupingiae]|uniref:Bifunctional diguanylate cyclase/phosphodiesterase n=1 Tax=Cellulomonas wangsupingiae TaxID=2968085 RepID=A0ABY5K6J5_9CELL|nr:bifunctional diguanylate cyclase/phosphodiesterase [Cellulomonas wangsupingiae]MCC2334909.1 bifunctional diguanylate cyclase/phosphodiesterase [Cellulomonas wangsupingiae]UUI65409.1 bifunctional diguanylate cyclase/phosphodiesterase [Cellulomonas wangsupingiae]
MAPPSTRTGTSDVLVRTTAFLFMVGGVAAALLAADVVLSGDRRGGVLLLLAVAAALTGPALLAAGPRIPTRTVGVGVLVGAGLLGAGTTLAPSLTLALASASLAMLVAVESMLFLRPRDAWVVVGLASAWQVLPLLVVHDVPPRVCAAYVVLWCGVAGAMGVLARYASTAGIDPLTGLADRRSWDSGLEQAIDRCRRRGVPLSLALIDIDHFKHVNDTQGHAAGDDLLRATADAWRAVEVPGMVLGRRGGDEFAALLPGRTGAEALTVADRLCRAVPTAASAGVAEHADGETAAEVLRRTDASLYAAKAAGRGRTVLSERRRHRLADDLAHALAAGGLRVELQPVVDLPTGTVSGVEALARWDHPWFGPVPPAEFVAAAEEAGLIDELGAAVLALACADAHVLQDAWGSAVHLGVNVSGRELTEQGYADRLLRALEAAHWPVTQFVLEVTESVVEASGPAALRALRTLRAAGVLVAIDDFGTGFSSLSRLDELPADLLKLDRSFLTSLTTSTRRTVMVRALLGLCADLDMLVVAEGVETAEQAALLEELGCRAAQGYHYGAPQPVAVLAAHPWQAPPPGRAPVASGG